MGYYAEYYLNAASSETRPCRKHRIYHLIELPQTFHPNNSLCVVAEQSSWLSIISIDLQSVQKQWCLVNHLYGSIQLIELPEHAGKLVPAGRIMNTYEYCQKVVH